MSVGSTGAPPVWLDWSRRLRHTAGDTVIADGAEQLDAMDSQVAFAAEHARRYINSDGADDGWNGPKPVCILYTLGRRSGRYRRTPVSYLDFEGGRYIVASKGGAPTHPAWYLNMQAEPTVRVRVGERLYPADAETVRGDERARVWPALTEWQPILAEYQRACPREMPVVRLTEVPDDPR